MGRTTCGGSSPPERLLAQGPLKATAQFLTGSVSFVRAMYRPLRMAALVATEARDVEQRLPAPVPDRPSMMLGCARFLITWGA